MSDGTVCPVCGNKKGLMPISEYDCDTCGFTNAFVNYFASTEGNRRWLRSVEKAKAEWLEKQKPKPGISNSLITASGAIAWNDTGKHTIYIALGRDALQIEEHAAGFSSSERNYAVLHDDGTVQVYGEENDFGQKNTSLWKDVKYVLVSPNCTYGIMSNGKIITAGIPASDNTGKWTDMIKIDGGSSFVVGLRKDGRASIAGVYKGSEKSGLIKGWTDIADIKAGRDYILALRNDGTVYYSGESDEVKTAVESWHNVVAIAGDNVYAYGLTDEGRVLMAGTCPRFLDRGRSKAAGWENISAISCNQTGIGAVTKNGELLFAGTIAGDIQSIMDIWEESIKKEINH